MTDETRPETSEPESATTATAQVPESGTTATAQVPTATEEPKKDDEPLKLTQAHHLGAARTETARYLGEVASAVGRVHGVPAMSPEFMRLGTVATVVDDADQ